MDSLLDKLTTMNLDDYFTQFAIVIQLYYSGSVVDNFAIDYSSAHF